MVTTMAQVKITELKCVKKQDSISPDEIRIEVDGKSISGPHKMKKNNTLKLSATADFTDSALIKIYEEDKNSNDDYLGSHKVYANEFDDGTQEAHFNFKKRADYHIKYSVTA
jgi:hypothetical protein